MKFFNNKNVFKKLVVIFICIFLLSFCVPKIVSAVDAEAIGGTLLNPIMGLFVGLGDGAMGLLQKVVFHSDTSLININTSASFWAGLIVAVIAIAVAAIAITAVILSGGTAIAMFIGVGKVVLALAGGLLIGYTTATNIVEGMLPESFYLPL